MIPTTRSECYAYEDERRTETWLDFPDVICGIEVDQLTLFHTILLTEYKNALFVGGNADASDISQFLWIIKSRKPKHFLRLHQWMFGFRVRRLLKKQTDTFKEAIKEYLLVSTMDAPPMQSSSGRSYTGWVSVYVDYFMKRYNWSKDNVLHRPVRQVYQLLRIIYKEYDPSMPLPCGLSIGL